MAGYIVTGPFAVVAVGEAGGNTLNSLLEQGRIVPDGVAEEQIQHLLSVGLISELDLVEDPTAPVLVEKSIDKMSATELKSYAAERGIDLGSATKVSEMRKVLTAAEGGADVVEAPVLANMTAEELINLAAARGIEVPEGVTAREDLVALIEQ